jgi:phospholipid/cholesterol/gamma-HCH transport system substrate-binding protein
MKRSENIAWSQVKAGIFIVFALLFFAGGVLLMGEKTKFFVPKGRLSVIMADVGGLKIGAPVWLAGMDVGIVRDIRFARPDRTNDVEIVLEIERAALGKVGRDSKVSVKTRGLMGEKYVDITPSQFLVESPETRIYGVSAPKLDDVMQKAGTAFDRINLALDKINQGEGTLGKFAKDPKLFNQLVLLTKELTTFAQSVNHGEGTLGRLNRSSEPYDRLLSVLNRADTTLKDIQTSEGTFSKLVNDRKLYDKLVALADKSAQAADDVRELNKKLTSKESTIGKLLGEREFYDRGISLIERADKAVGSFEEIANRVNSGEGTAGRLIIEQDIYDRMNRMLDNVDALVKDIRENPKRYVKFSLF